MPSLGLTASSLVEITGVSAIAGVSMVNETYFFVLNGVDGNTNGIYVYTVEDLT